MGLKRLPKSEKYWCTTLTYGRELWNELYVYIEQNLNFTFKTRFNTTSVMKTVLSVYTLLINTIYLIYVSIPQYTSI